MSALKAVGNYVFREATKELICSGSARVRHSIPIGCESVLDFLIEEERDPRHIKWINTWAKPRFKEIDKIH
jgi:hypothetical protein